MILRIRQLTPLLFLLAFSLGGWAQHSATMPVTANVQSASRVNPPLPGYRFPAPETLLYAVDWRLFNAGTATIRLESGGGDMKVTAAADALGVVGLLYHVHDRFESHFDPATFCSLRLTKHTEEGLRRLDTQITFESARNKSVLSEKNLRNDQSKKQENDIPGCVTDVVSGLFYLRSQPLIVGAIHQFPLNDGGKTVDVKAEVEGREEVQSPAGRFKTLRVSVSAASGVIKNRGQIWVWYTDDFRHLPVQMKARLFWGTLTFRLQSVSNK